jgi:hypothetical protein
MKIKRNKTISDSLKALNQRVLPILCRRLGSKGLTRVEIKLLTEDILNIFGHGGFYSTGILNRKLEHLGWGKNILDNHLLDLILYYLEREGTYTVISYIKKNQWLYELHR